MKPSIGPFAYAVRAVRNALGETQEGMARRLGVSLSGYKFWESGDRTPSAGWIIKLQALCPDEDTRALFGGGPVNSPYHRPRPGRKLTEEQEEIVRNYNDAATGINILFEVADSGHRGAAEALRRLADEINKRAGDWRRMKYFRKVRSE